MLTITPELYNEVAQRTREAIDKAGYIETVMQFDHSDEGVFYSLYLSAIIYRNKLGRIVDIAPIWWEFSSTTPDKGAVLNDFVFNEVKSLIIKK